MACKSDISAASDECVTAPLPHVLTADGGAPESNSLAAEGVLGSWTGESPSMSTIPAQPPSHRAEPPPEAGRPQRPPLSTSEAAARIGVHERTLRRYLSRGLLAHHRLPGSPYRT